jgi:hypothetical protein
MEGIFHDSVSRSGQPTKLRFNSAFSNPEERLKFCPMQK